MPMSKKQNGIQCIQKVLNSGIRVFRKKKRVWHLNIIFLLGLLFFVHRFLFLFSDLSKNVYSIVLYPVLLSQKYVVLPIKDFFQHRKTKQELQDLVCRLQVEKERLLSENITLNASCAYFEQIGELIHFKKRYDFSELKLSQIIFKHINNKSHFVFVNQGAWHGIKQDMVAVYKNVLIGRVVEVYPLYSKVILTTDRSCKVASFCAKTRANGIHVGQNSLEQTMLFRVSHLLRIIEGDLILSSGEGLVFPQGFALGKIVSAKKGELYYDIKVKPILDLDRIQYCFLIKKG